MDFGFNRFIETFTKLRNAMPAKDLMFLKQKNKKKNKQTNVLICNKNPNNNKSSIKPFQTRNKRQRKIKQNYILV